MHLSRKHGLAEFPDSVTERGAKHLAEMSDMVRDGPPRGDGLPDPARRRQTACASRATSIRPMAPPSTRADAAGVEAIALRCRMSTEEIVVDKPVPIAG